MTGATAPVPSQQTTIQHGNSDGLVPSPSPHHQLMISFNAEQRAMWLRWRPAPRPCFNPTLLGEMSGCFDDLASSGGILRCDREESPLEYTITASDTPGIYN